MPEPDGRRRRPTVSCVLCRKRKIKCDRQLPCSNCTRSGNDNCSYGSQPRAPSYGSRATVPRDLGQMQAGIPHHPMAAGVTSARDGMGASAMPTPSSLPGAAEVELASLREKVRRLEEQLATSAAEPASSNPAEGTTPRAAPVRTVTSQLSGAFYLNYGDESDGTIKSVNYRGRFFGRSHWAVHGIMPYIELADIFESQPEASLTNIWAGIDKCKAVSRTIKARRAPAWPSSTAPRLPSKEVADSLVEGYMRTSEAIFRILHIPSFRRQYEVFWEPRDEPQDPTFLIQLQLVLAIGSTTYDDNFSLRPEALEWVSTVHTWLHRPGIKARLDLASLQIDLLYMLAQEKIALGESTSYILAGALLRKAMYMGIHCKPNYLPQNGATLAGEMRRRLWNTIMEVSMLSSLSTGGPPLISLDDFDIEAPANLDDDQLLAGGLGVPHPIGHWTQASVSVLLRETLSQRLAIVKFLNDTSSSHRHPEAMKLDANFREAYKQLSRRLQSYRGIHDSGPGPSEIELLHVDFIMHRYLSALHCPYATCSVKNASFCYSRQATLDSSLKIWRAAHPAPLTMDSGTQGQYQPSEGQILMRRLVTCTAGFYPTVAIQAALLVGQELRMQLQQHEGLTPAQVRPDLLPILEDSKTWCLQAINAGETNVKGLVLMTMVTAHIHGLLKGLNGQGLTGMLATEVDASVGRCLPILEHNAAKLEGRHDNTDPTATQLLNTDRDDWGFFSSGMFLENAEDDLMVYMDDFGGVGGTASFL